MKKPSKTRVVVHFTTSSLYGIDHLVKHGVYMNRQTVIRDAVRILLFEKYGLEPFTVTETTP
ncbi:hypothetical protein ES703_100494 [subsurface metagenome]